jgi:hypothetical protein
MPTPHSRAEEADPRSMREVLPTGGGSTGGLRIRPRAAQAADRHEATRRPAEEASTRCRASQPPSYLRPHLPPWCRHLPTRSEPTRSASGRQSPESARRSRSCWARLCPANGAPSATAGPTPTTFRPGGSRVTCCTTSPTTFFAAATPRWPWPRCQPTGPPGEAGTQGLICPIEECLRRRLPRARAVDGRRPTCPANRSRCGTLRVIDERLVKGSPIEPLVVLIGKIFDVLSAALGRVLLGKDESYPQTRRPRISNL